jgi:folate-binding Fe-S cluster repair protein YgfZ
VVPLASRALLALRGSDCIAFLQGMATQDMHLLAKQPAVYTMFLTGKAS